MTASSGLLACCGLREFVEHQPTYGEQLAHATAQRSHVDSHGVERAAVIHRHVCRTFESAMAGRHAA